MICNLTIVSTYIIVYSQLELNRTNSLQLQIVGYDFIIIFLLILLY